MEVRVYGDHREMRGMPPELWKRLHTLHSLWGEPVRCVPSLPAEYDAKRLVHSNSDLLLIVADAVSDKPFKCES